MGEERALGVRCCSSLLYPLVADRVRPVAGAREGHLRFLPQASFLPLRASHMLQLNRSNATTRAPGKRSADVAAEPST